MIETTAITETAPNAPPARTHEKVLRMVKNERMGGFVPVWERVKTDQQAIEANLGQAQAQTQSTKDTESLTYAPSSISEPGQSGDPFGFGDFVDMINPLQHLPVVGYAYRQVTGDEIKPIGKLVGGALFGGPLGAASSLVNVIVEHETGNSIEGNAMALAFGKNDRGGKETNIEITRLNDQSTAQERTRNLEQAQQNNQPATTSAAINNDPTLASTLLAFTDLRQNNIVIERTRTASYEPAPRPDIKAKAIDVREPITQVRFSARSYNG